MAKALLIDDDKKHSELLRAYFKRCGINRVCAYEVESGFRLFNREGPKLLLLDVMLPDKDGFKISGGGGPGLGLYLETLVAEAHRGYLRLANRDQDGACFECRIPFGFDISP